MASAVTITEPTAPARSHSSRAPDDRDARSTRAARTLSIGSHDDLNRAGSHPSRPAPRPTSSYSSVLNNTGEEPKPPGLPGGRLAIAAFLTSLAAYTVQTEFAQHVQQTLNYKKPFLSLFIGHSAFVTILPAHLLFLKLSTGRSIRTHYLRLISENLRWQTDEPKLFSRAVLGTPRSTADSLPSHTPSRSDGRIRAFWKDLIGFDLGRYALIIAILTVGITIPALSWYAAVPMTSMADITALYNCFAVAALVFSVWFLGDRWQAYKVFSVLLAVGGVVVVSYGGAEHKKSPRPVDPVKGAPHGADPAASSSEFPHPFLGDMLALLGAVTMGLYEIAFKLIGTLPDEELQMQLHGQGNRINQRSGEARRRVHSTHSYIEYRAVDRAAEAAEEEEEEDEGKQSARGPTNYQSMGTSQPGSQRASLEAGKAKQAAAAQAYIQEAESSEAESELDDADLEEIGTGASTRLSRTTSRGGAAAGELAHAKQPGKRILQEVPPPLPFGMHANLMTSSIGLMTLSTLWIGAVAAHFLGWERFELPHNWETVASIAVVAICGVFFNACFMILLSIWGPVLASVSCLLTTVLVQIADILLGRPVKLLSLVGCAFIGMGFVVLIAGERKSHSH